MTSTARQALRATFALTGMAALGAGAATPALAAETTTPNVDIAQLVEFNKLHTAGVDGFNTDSMVPVDSLAGNVAGVLAAAQARHATSGPTDSLTSIGQLPGFNFELPQTDFGTAGPTDLAALGTVGSGALQHVAVPTAGEQQFNQVGVGPMMNPVMQYAVPAVLGGQRMGTAGPSDESFGQDNGLPQPVNGPANDAASPVTGSLMPAVASTFGTISDSTTNDGTTSNHEFQV